LTECSLFNGSSNNSIDYLSLDCALCSMWLFNLATWEIVHITGSEMRIVFPLLILFENKLNFCVIPTNFMHFKWSDV
jgi:hypothetical protein